MMFSPLVRPVDPDASVTFDNGRLVGHTTGYVRDIDPRTSTIRVTSSLLGFGAVPVTVGNDTRIQIREKRGAFDNLNQYMPVHVVYEIRDTMRLATSIELLEAPGTAHASTLDAAGRPSVGDGLRVLGRGGDLLRGGCRGCPRGAAAPAARERDARHGRRPSGPLAPAARTGRPLPGRGLGDCRAAPPRGAHPPGLGALEAFYAADRGVGAGIGAAIGMRPGSIETKSVVNAEIRAITVSSVVNPAAFTVGPST